jgi:hypothetical protein
LYVTLYAQARQQSLCQGVIDHLFPHSRGGAADVKNAAVIHHAANAHVKRDLILQSIHPQHMLVGISAPQLMAIFSYIERGDHRRGNNFLNSLHYAIFAMEMTPLPGSRYFNFQKQSNGSLDGEELFAILMEYHSSNIPVYQAPALVAGGGGATPTKTPNKAVEAGPMDTFVNRK